MEPRRSILKTSFSDDGALLSQFAETVDVLCPQCDVPGIVMRTFGNVPGPRFACGACGFSLAAGTMAWFRPWQAIYKGRCQSCHAKSRVEVSGEKGSIAASKKLHCSQCGHQVTAKMVTWSGDRGVCDPYFGMTLRWQIPVGGETLWAYNRDHLDFIQAYVEAGNRFRQANRNASLASRLPKWIKQAGQRESLSKVIQKLIFREENDQ